MQTCICLLFVHADDMPTERNDVGIAARRSVI